MRRITWGVGLATGTLLVAVLGAALARFGSGNTAESSPGQPRATERVAEASIHGQPTTPGVDRLRDGTELIGTPAPGWEGVEWLGGDAVQLRDLRGRVVLVRWWTDTCPFCRRSAPALNEFHDRFTADGLVVIGMYHPKPIRRPISSDGIRAAADERGFQFSIAIDRDWSTLRRWWLEGRRRLATSVSFLIDKRGIIRYVHPGPAYHREVLHGDDRPRRDFFELQGMIETLLAEPS